MSIYRPKKSPHWHYDFQVRGVRFHGSTGTADKTAARQVEARKRIEAAEGRAAPKAKVPTLNEAFGRYFDEHGQHQKTADDIEYQLANLLAGLGADTRLSDLATADIARYMAKRRADVSNTSVNHETRKLRAVWNRAVEVWDLDLGRAPKWARLWLPEPAPRSRTLSTDEESALFEHLRADMHPLVRFCLLTGARLTSAIRLTWRDVDYAAGVLTFRTMKSARDGECHAIPITPALAALIAERRGEHAIYVFTYLCQRSRGRRRKGDRYPFSKDGWRRDWARALAAAGIEDFRFHDLRHDAATKTLRACGNLAVVQRMLGHADIASTRRYAHVVADDVAAAMQAAATSRTIPEPAGTEAVKTLKANAK